MFKLDAGQVHTSPPRQSATVGHGQNFHMGIHGLSTSVDEEFSYRRCQDWNHIQVKAPCTNDIHLLSLSFPCPSLVRLLRGCHQYMCQGCTRRLSPNSQWPSLFLSLIVVSLSHYCFSLSLLLRSCSYQFCTHCSQSPYPANSQKAIHFCSLPFTTVS